MTAPSEQSDWRPAAWSLLDQAVSSATSFAVSLLLGRLIIGDYSRDTLGEYALTLSVFGFALLIQQDLLCLPFTVLRPGMRPRRQRLFAGSIFLLHFALSAVAMLATGALALGLWYFHPVHVVYSLAALIVATPAMLMREYLRRYNLAIHDARTAATWDGVALVAVVAALLGLAWTETLTSWTTVLALGAVNLVVSSLCLWQMRPDWRLGKWPRIMADAAESWQFSSWNLASGLLACAPVLVLPWILATTSGAAETGLFAACAALVGFPTVLTAGLQNHLIPRFAMRFAREGTHALRGDVLVGTLVLNSIATAFLLLVVLTGDGLVQLLYGEQFAGSGWTLLALAGALWFHSINAAFMSFLQAVQKSRANVLPNLADLVITLSTLVFLGGAWGATGAALARLAGAVVATALRGLALRNVLAESGTEHRMEATPA